MGALDQLSADERERILNKASYLINAGYLRDCDLFEAAETIAKKLIEQRQLSEVENPNSK